MPLSFLKPRQNSPLNLVWKEGMITAQGCQQIVDLGEHFAAKPASMAGPQAAAARQSTIAFMPQQKETAALFNLIRKEVETINEQHFGFDLVGFGEHLQYARYGSSNDHYDWHVDAGPGPTSIRKLSVTIQLSDGAEYDGGDVECQTVGITKLPRKLGTFAVFSSFMLHRVTAVTRGERKSLVAWISGPPFR
jgi:PKHD-type hydroxylase